MIVRGRGCRNRVFSPFDEWVVLGLFFPKKRVLELMLVVVGLVLGEGVEVELPEERAVVAMSVMLGKEDSAKLRGLMHHEGLSPLTPADEWAVLLFIENLC